MKTHPATHRYDGKKELFPRQALVQSPVINNMAAGYLLAVSYLPLARNKYPVVGAMVYGYVFVLFLFYRCGSGAVVMSTG